MCGPHQVWPLRSECCGRGVPTKVVCAECMKMCCLGGKNSVVKGLKRWDLGYQELLHLAQIPTLENRRIYLKLCTLFKIIHGLFPFTPDVFMPQPSRHNYNLPFLYQPFAHTNAFQASFVPSTVSIWNHLPPPPPPPPPMHLLHLHLTHLS